MPSQLAFSPLGTAAAAFGTEDVDTPGSSQAAVATLTPSGAIGGPLTVPGAGQVLALGYDGGGLELLTGSSGRGLTCCSSAGAIQVTAAGHLGPTRTLVGGLTGPTQAQLLTLADGQMLALVATERGVWVLQSTAANRFASPHRLTAAGQLPAAISAAWLGGESTVVAWTAGSGLVGESDPRSIYLAYGSRTRAPRTVTTAITIPAGHRIDELSIAPRAGAPTLAWIESWSDASGGYHSLVRATDVGARATVRTLSPAGRLASGLTLAGDQAGDQAISWESCTFSDSCSVTVAMRPAASTFQGARTLGALDPSQAPALAVGPAGQVLLAWIRGGQPIAATASSPKHSFGATVTLSPSRYAGEIAAAVGPRRRALAAWTQGTLNPSLVAAAETLP